MATIDLLPFMNPFTDEPVMSNALWKAGFSATLLVRYPEHVIRLSLNGEGAKIATTARYKPDYITVVSTIDTLRIY